MLVSKFSAALAAAFLVVRCGLAHTKTGLPEVGVSAPRAGAQGRFLLITSTGPSTATPMHEPAASAVVIPNELLRAQSAAQPDDALYNTSDSSLLFNMSPFSRLGSALLVNS